MAAELPGFAGGEYLGGAGVVSGWVLRQGGHCVSNPKQGVMLSAAKHLDTCSGLDHFMRPTSRIHSGFAALNMTRCFLLGERI